MDNHVPLIRFPKRTRRSSRRIRQKEYNDSSVALKQELAELIPTHLDPSNSPSSSSEIKSGPNDSRIRKLLYRIVNKVAGYVDHGNPLPIGFKGRDMVPVYTKEIGDEGVMRDIQLTLHKLCCAVSEHADHGRPLILYKERSFRMGHNKRQLQLEQDGLSSKHIPVKQRAHKKYLGGKRLREEALQERCLRLDEVDISPAIISFKMSKPDGRRDLRKLFGDDVFNTVQYVSIMVSECVDNKKEVTHNPALLSKMTRFKKLPWAKNVKGNRVDYHRENPGKRLHEEALQERCLRLDEVDVSPAIISFKMSKPDGRRDLRKLFGDDVFNTVQYVSIMVSECVDNKKEVTHNPALLSKMTRFKKLPWAKNVKGNRVDYHRENPGFHSKSRTRSKEDWNRAVEAYHRLPNSMIAKSDTLFPFDEAARTFPKKPRVSEMELDNKIEFRYDDDGSFNPFMSDSD